MLGGEAGIGKTRLLGELARQAHEAGAMVLAGRSPEETLVPYQPFLEALGHYAFSAPLEDLRAVTRRSGPELGKLIPELRRRLPELGRPEPGDPETDRYRLFEAVAGLLGEISASASLLVVLDDLHWADRPTLLLLRHLARAPQASGLRVLAANRAPEHASETFESALSGLRHERLVRELEVRGLPEADTAELVRQRTSGPPSAAFVRAVHAGTEGNPFFIEEMVRHLAEAGVRSHEAGAGELLRVGLPDGVRGVISRRLERLDADGLECLKVASVIGRDFESSLLEAVLGFDEDRFLRALEVGARHRPDHGVTQRAWPLPLRPRPGARDPLRRDVLATPGPGAPAGGKRSRAAARPAAGRAGPSLHPGVSARGRRAGDPLRGGRRRAGDRDARQRGGRRALRPGARGPPAPGPRRRQAPLRAVARARRGPGAQRRAAGGLGRLPRGGLAGQPDG